MTNLERPRILLSAQRALLDAVTPELRAVDVTWSDEEIRLRFTVDAEREFDMDDLANEIEGEIEADFIPDARVSSTVLCLPQCRQTPIFDELDGGNARVFARREI